MNEKYTQLPNSSDHNCFGCSPINKSGLQMKFYADDNTVYSDITVPDHLCGWSNITHGGVLTTILDEIMSWTALHFIKRITMTKTMEIEFIKPETRAQQEQQHQRHRPQQAPPGASTCRAGHQTYLATEGIGIDRVSITRAPVIMDSPQFIQNKAGVTTTTHLSPQSKRHAGSH